MYDSYGPPISHHSSCPSASKIAIYVIIFISIFHCISSCCLSCSFTSSSMLIGDKIKSLVSDGTSNLNYAKNNINSTVRGLPDDSYTFGNAASSGVQNIIPVVK